MIAPRKLADENRALEIEEAPAPSMTEVETRAFIESLERAEKEIESGNYRVLVPDHFLTALKASPFLSDLTDFLRKH